MNRLLKATIIGVSIFVFGCSKSSEEPLLTPEATSEQVTESEMTSSDESSLTEKAEMYTSATEEPTQSVPVTTVTPDVAVPTPEKKEGMGNVNILKSAADMADDNDYEVIVIAEDDIMAYAEYYDGYIDRDGVSLRKLMEMESLSDRQSADLSKLRISVMDRISADEETWLAEIGAKDIIKLGYLKYVITMKGCDTRSLGTGRCNYDVVIRNSGDMENTDVSAYYGDYKTGNMTFGSIYRSSSLNDMVDSSVRIDSDKVYIANSEGKTNQFTYKIASKAFKKENGVNYLFGFNASDYIMMDKKLFDRIVVADAVLELTGGFNIILAGNHVYFDNGSKELYEMTRQA